MTKTKLLDAALTVFAQSGYDAGSMAQIAQAAGVSKSLAYHYFPRKQDILVSLASKRLEEVLSVVEPLQQILDPKKRLSCLIDLVIKHLQRDPCSTRFWNTLYLTEAGIAAIKGAKAAFKEQFAQLYRVETEIFRDLGLQAPETEALLFRSILQGIALEYVLSDRTYPLQEVKAALLQKYSP